MSFPVRRLWLAVFWVASIVVAGCATPDAPNLLALGRKQDRTDTVPGIVPPAERIAVLRKLGQKAAWAKGAERERTSADLATAFREEGDPIIRAEIVRAIGAYGTASSQSVVRAALEDSDRDVRVAACDAIGKQHTPEAVTLLSAALGRDVDVDVRLAAARALGRTGQPTAVSALAEALEDRDPAMQFRAVESLELCTGEDFGRDVNRWRQYVHGQTPPPPEPVSIAQRIRGLF
jgi:hypothetical protein